MFEGLIFVLAFAITAIVAGRLKQGPIVWLGGGLIVGCFALAAFGPRSAAHSDASYDDALGVVWKSSDYDIYREAFADAALRLVNKRECTLGDFTAQGGWVKSDKLTTQDTYFVQCGGARV